MTKCFAKFFWRKFWRFRVRRWFSMFFALKVFSKFFSGNREHGVYGGFWAFFLFRLPFPWFPIRVSIHLRFASDDSPIFLRSFFDRFSIAERRTNGERTENERRTNGEQSENNRGPNGGWTEVERSSNGERTEDERSSNGGSTEDERRMNGGWTELERSLNGVWTEVERSPNGARTEDERSSNGARTELERSPNGGWTELERRINGGWTENDWKPNGERTEELTLLAKRSVFLRYDIGMPSELSSAKMERVLASLWVQSYNAKSKFSANLWCFENAERWKWKYKANNGSPVKPCVWLFE